MQYLLLSFGKLREQETQPHDSLVLARRTVVRLPLTPPAFQPREPQPPLPCMLPRGLPNDSEQPRFERRPPRELRRSIEHLHVRTMQHVFCVCRIAAAAAHRPRVRLEVDPGQLGSQIEL